MKKRREYELTPDMLGNIMRDIRNESKLSLVNLAEKIDMPEKTIRRVENGENSPSFNNLYTIMNELGWRIVLQEKLHRGRQTKKAAQ